MVISKDFVVCDTVVWNNLYIVHNLKHNFNHLVNCMHLLLEKSFEKVREIIWGEVMAGMFPLICSDKHGKQHKVLLGFSEKMQFCSTACLRYMC